MENSIITEKMLEVLRKEISSLMSASRFKHTLGVENTAKELARLYCPELEAELCAAALLHDITKELGMAAQAEILARHGIRLKEEYIKAPATLHAITAAAIIPESYTRYATPTVINSVRYHTTGRADMTLAEKIIYIADFIEPNRQHQVCQDLRRAFFDAEPYKMSAEQRLLHLDTVILTSLEATLAHLEELGGFISPDTKEAQEHIKKLTVTPFHN